MSKISQIATSKKDRNVEFVQIYVGLLITGQPTFEQSLNALCAVSSGGEVFQIVTSLSRKSHKSLNQNKRAAPVVIPGSLKTQAEVTAVQKTLSPLNLFNYRLFAI